MSRTQVYGGERYIWTLAQAARAKQMFPEAHYPPTWEGLEALQRQVAMSGRTVPNSGPWHMQWARTAFADANARLNPTYEKVPA